MSILAANVKLLGMALNFAIGLKWLTVGMFHIGIMYKTTGCRSSAAQLSVLKAMRMFY